jgi:hypothetical protein
MTIFEPASVLRQHGSPGGTALLMISGCWACVGEFPSNLYSLSFCLHLRGVRAGLWITKYHGA